MSDSELAEALRGAIEIAEKRGTQRDALRAENALLKTQLAEADFNFGGWRSIKARLEAENAALKATIERFTAPVSDEDVDRLSFVLGMLHDDSAPSSREDVRVAMNNLIAIRVKETKCK